MARFTNLSNAPFSTRGSHLRGLERLFGIRFGLSLDVGGRNRDNTDDDDDAPDTWEYCESCDDDVSCLLSECVACMGVGVNCGDMFECDLGVGDGVGVLCCERSLRVDVGVSDCDVMFECDLGVGDGVGVL